MSDLTGATAFDCLLQELLQRASVVEENKRLKAELNAATTSLRAAYVQRDSYLARAQRAEAGAQHITDLWRETECVQKVLVLWSKGSRMRREVAAEHAADLKRRLDAASDYVDLIPF